VVAKEAYVVEDEVYCGGIVDKSLLVSYKDHVARQLWNGVVGNNVEISNLNLICYLLHLNSQMIFIGNYTTVVS